MMLPATAAAPLAAATPAAPPIATVRNTTLYALAYLAGLAATGRAARGGRAADRRRRRGGRGVPDGDVDEEATGEGERDDDDGEAQPSCADGGDAARAAARRYRELRATAPARQVRAAPRRGGGRAWDAFFAAHSGRFFKDRHYLVEEHASLARMLQTGGVRMCELGCGAGNAAVPLLEAFDGQVAAFAGVDASAEAVELFRRKVAASGGERAGGGATRRALRCDVSLGVADVADARSVPMPASAFDVCLLVFVLSAIEPARMANVARHAFERLRPGGRLLVRDYAWGDQAQKRFPAAQRMGRGLYVRQDGTLSFFFTVEGLCALMSDAGFKTEFCGVVARDVSNRARRVSMQRLWVGAEFVKPRSA